MHPDIEEVTALITPHARVLMVNSPSNPGGMVFLPARSDETAERHNLAVSDECDDQVVATTAPARLARRPTPSA